MHGCTLLCNYKSVGMSFINRFYWLATLLHFKENTFQNAKLVGHFKCQFLECVKWYNTMAGVAMGLYKLVSTMDQYVQNTGGICAQCMILISVHKLVIPHSTVLNQDISLPPYKCPFSLIISIAAEGPCSPISLHTGPSLKGAVLQGLCHHNGAHTISIKPATCHFTALLTGGVPAWDLWPPGRECPPPPWLCPRTVLTQRYVESLGFMVVTTWASTMSLFILAIFRSQVKTCPLTQLTGFISCPLSVYRDLFICPGPDTTGISPTDGGIWHLNGT